ncbi:cupin domain-containing protein [Maritalea mediterranea]|uniref:Cupin domain-containing protein n=1 Tax=Maritalea mediterranea TaxID=2909667 RepID=A0ABS9E401_9HYPH|nr:cupin domain-containing protein [Maritalea mediterranea]MCF4097595.1 cupin domain-containing protein [Maritalea mediterranea]
MPKIDMPNWTAQGSEPHPLTGQNDGPYAEKALGKAAGLTGLGVRMEKLPPGSASSHRHWHENEDEFLLMLTGELVLVEEEETILRPGDCAAWKAGSKIGHCLQNRSGAEASYLIVSNNQQTDRVIYPDHDLVFHRDGQARRFTKLDGSELE